MWGCVALPCHLYDLAVFFLPSFCISHYNNTCIKGYPLTACWTITEPTLYFRRGRIYLKVTMNKQLPFLLCGNIDTIPHIYSHTLVSRMANSSKAYMHKVMHSLVIRPEVLVYQGGSDSHHVRRYLLIQQVKTHTFCR